MAKEKTAFDFNKLTLEDMVKYVVDNELKEKIDLKKFLEEKEKYKLVNVNDAEGKPQTYVSKKTGKIKIKKKQIVLSVLAIFVMFIPRSLSLAGIFSFRFFIIIATLIAFLLLGVSIKISGLIRMPTFWIYIGVVAMVQLAHAEYTTMLGTLLDTLILYVVLSSCLSSKSDMDFFVRIFLFVLILYSTFCVVETMTGFNPWSLVGADVNSFVRFGIHRAYGAYTTSINNGVFLMLTFPLSWYAQKLFLDKRLSTVAIIATWIALICTMSRGPILFAIALNIAIVWKSGLFRFFKRNTLKIIIVILIIGCLLMIPAFRSVLDKFLNMFMAVFDPTVAEEINEDFGSNAVGIGHRNMLFSWVWQDLNGHYWFGVGANTPLHHAWRTSHNTISIKESIENFYLSTLYHYGIVGLTALIAFLTEVSCRLFVKYRVERKLFALKKASDSILFRFFMTFICYYGVVFTVSAVDDFKMFFILLAIVEAYYRFIVREQADNADSPRLSPASD